MESYQPERRVLHCVRMRGCQKSKGGLELRLLRKMSDHVEHGCYADALWLMKMKDTPSRAFRLFKGRQSIESLIDRYVFSDSSGCAYTQNREEQLERTLRQNAASVNARIKSIPALESEQTIRSYTSSEPPNASWDERSAMEETGMAQPSESSGACWFSALLWVLCRPPGMRETVLHHLKDDYFRSLLGTCLKDTSRALEFKRAVNSRLGLGDKIGIEPEEEGQNGYTQMTMMMSRWGVPMTTLIADASGTLHPFEHAFPDANNKPVSPPRRPQNGEPALLGVRVHQGYWEPEQRLTHNGRTYELKGCFLGSEFCGHQTGLSFSGNGTFQFCDADAVRLGIGPTTFCCSPDDFWSTMQYILPYSNQTRSTKFCDFSPHNQSPLQLLQNHFIAEGRPIRGSNLDAKQHRVLNVDWVYCSP